VDGRSEEGREGGNRKAGGISQLMRQTLAATCT
jgi:hypothetical protein